MDTNDKIISIQPFIEEQKQDNEELNALRKEVDDLLFSTLNIFAIDLEAK